jgi:hypothetical protein
MPPIQYRSADVDGFKIFYREAGLADAFAIEPVEQDSRLRCR